MTAGSILILIPSLNRPKQLAECVTSLCATAGGRFDFIALTEESSYVEALNAVPMEFLARYDILGIIGDDCRMRTVDWDGQVQSALAGKVGMAYGRDGIQDAALPTQPFISSVICRELGFVLPPDFRQYFTDDWMLALAKGCECRHYLPDLFTEHMHVSMEKSPNDDTYRRSSGWFHDDREAWFAYKRGGKLARDIDLVKGLMK